MNDGPDRGASRRILFLAPNWLGDVIMASPALSVLRKTFETAAALT